MKPMQICALIFSAVFFVCLWAPGCLHLLGADRHHAAAENRQLAPWPEPTGIWKSYPDYTRSFERYYGDSFGLRDRLIRWNNLLRLRLFGESPVKGVRLGRDGWLFYADEWVFEDYENIMPYTARQLDQIKTNLLQRQTWLANRGIRFFVVVPPNKHTVYPEHLPPTIHKLGARSRLDQVVELLHDCPQIEFIDLRKPLLNAKVSQRLYHRTDTHWNDYGSFIGYRELMQRVGRSLPNSRKLEWSDYTVRLELAAGGDLARMLSLSDLIREERIVLTPKFAPRAKVAHRDYPDPVDFPGRAMVVHETGNPSWPRAVVFRDSYAWGLIPYLSESFRSVVYVWTFRFLPDLVIREQADVVILECVERYLNALLIENPPEVAAAASPRTESIRAGG